MKKIVVYFMLFIICALCSCSHNNTETEVQRHSSSALKYDEVVQYCAKLQGLSEEDSISELHKAGIEKDIPENNNERTYRFLYAPIKENEKICELIFLVGTKEVNPDWEMIDIGYAWVNEPEDSKLLFIGAVSLWIREEKGIEYAVNGALCKVSDMAALETKTNRKSKEITIYTRSEAEVKKVAEIYNHDTIYF